MRRNLLLSLLDSAFHGGLFHGDLHAGNVLVDDAGHTDPDDEGRRRLEAFIAGTAGTAGTGSE